MVRHYFTSQPFFIKKETTFIFVNTLPDPYYDKMIGNAMRNFFEMLWSDELINHAIKNKKIEENTTSASVRRATPTKKKEGGPKLSLLTSNLKDKLRMLAILFYWSPPTYLTFEL